ncbi:helix-turn-helix domain-containing protein [Streptomyces sp. NPDC020141]|uniref:helix-turn-helix domain-containing protein n=1 Tax=Streptomyces sp. NPDC020141 TaxID=3365065 RepID=UPI00378EEAFA
MSATELGEFLCARRARTVPESVGITARYTGRRVPGLRREELARLAGVSVAYYTRLEQGHSQNASDSVLDGLARALRLDDAERTHLYDLARAPRRRAGTEPAPETPHPRTLALLDSLPGLPAVLLGRRNDVLAWNRLGHALLAGHLDFDAPRTARRPSLSRTLFLDPRSRETEADWDAYAAVHVGHLRMVAGRYPDDPELAALIRELTRGSEEFAALWAAGRVRDCTFGERRLRHPLVGEITLTYQVWLQPDSPDCRLEVLTAEPGTASADALAALATLAPDPADRPTARRHR